MCVTPKTFDGYEVSCRECNQCAATYKNTWVARCVAEKQTNEYAYAVTLTYADVDGVPPLGARVYRYSDVAKFWKRIRAAARYRWGENIDFRYVVVGEKGTKFGRCHYHAVVFSSHPIIELGDFSGPCGAGFEYKRRLKWSLWGHGFIEFQIADVAGMAYVLKYVLKSRMTAAKSAGYAREGRTEWLASSYLWCSKRPAIGARWLFNKLDELYSLGMCPPALRVRVPGGGDWYIAGQLQKDFCLELHRLNKRYFDERGKNLAGWAELVRSVSEPIENSETGELVDRKPLEWLKHGEIEEKTGQEISDAQSAREFERFAAGYSLKRRIAAPITGARAAVRNCGGIVPCEKCANSLAERNRANLQQEHAFRFAEWSERFARRYRESEQEYAARFDQWWRSRLRISRGCALRDTPELVEQFSRLVPLVKADPAQRYKKSVGAALQKKT